MTMKYFTEYPRALGGAYASKGPWSFAGELRLLINSILQHSGILIGD